MKYTISVVVFLIGISARAEFCFQSFNTYGPAYALNLKKRTKLFSQLLKLHTHCELMVLQEVWRQSHKKRLKKNLRNLDDSIEFYHGDALDDNFKTGLLLSSQYKILSTNTYYYIQYPNGALDWVRKQVNVRKAFSSIVVDMNDNHFNSEVEVINTHLHPTSKVIRLAQIIELSEYLKTSPWRKKPLILAGDFNAQPHSFEWDVIVYLLGLRDAHIQTNSEYLSVDCTYCEDNPMSWGGKSRVLDFVFYRSGANVALNPIVSQVYPKTHKGQYLSDHFGKKVSFELTVSPSESSPIQRPVDSYTKTLLNRLLKLFKQQKSSNFDYVQNIIEKRLSELGSVNPQRIASSCDDLLQPAF